MHKNSHSPLDLGIWAYWTWESQCTAHSTKLVSNFQRALESSYSWERKEGIAMEVHAFPFMEPF